MIRIFLVDDHAVLRSGLRSLLADQPGLSVVGEASNGLELLEQLRTTPTDVVLLDVNMPAMNGPETARQLREHYPNVRILVLSMLDSMEYLFPMLDEGAAGYLFKSAGLAEIVHGIRTVAPGRTFLCSDAGFAALYKLRALSEPAAADTWQEPLSKRERSCYSSLLWA